MRDSLGDDWYPIMRTTLNRYISITHDLYTVIHNAFTDINTFCFFHFSFLLAYKLVCIILLTFSFFFCRESKYKKFEFSPMAAASIGDLNFVLHLMNVKTSNVFVESDTCFFFLLPEIDYFIIKTG